ncbi:unnamed protein product, partial [Iphiclides podalirius]
MHNSLYFLLPLISLTLQATVKWLPDTSFDLPINFKGRKRPCSKQSVVFPDRLVGPVKIEAETIVTSVLLPVDGEILLGGSVEFGADDNETSCGAGYVYYMEKSEASWAQAGVWGSSRFNMATPDSERVPCYDDTVEFPANIRSTVIMPMYTQQVAGFRIGDRLYNNENLYARIVSDTGGSLQFVSTWLTVGVVVSQKVCQSVSGCPCQKYALEIQCFSKTCAVPTCVHPIKPIGHCCKVCGGSVAFNVTETFDMEAFKELVAGTVNSYANDEVEYHVSRLPESEVQVVIVDKGEYEGTSAQVLNAIAYRMQQHWVKGSKYVQLSGSPLYKSGMGGKIFVSMFFVALSAIGAIYVYYYKIPDIRYPIMGRLPTFFARLQRRTDSVVSLTRRDSVITSTGVRTAFRNPLYDSKRGRVQVEETDTVQ